MSVKFLVGMMESEVDTGRGIDPVTETHYLTKLDYIIEVKEGKVAYIDRLLRDADREFIRSDTRYRTFVSLDIFLEDKS